jgi:hypothetical protein
MPCRRVTVLSLAFVSCITSISAAIPTAEGEHLNRPTENKSKLYVSLLVVPLFMAGCPSRSAAQGVGKFCPFGTCDITNPVYVNVYWDSSKSQWDQDEIAASQGDMLTARIDALTRALTHTNYFVGLSGYGVVGATFLRSIASACVPVPATWTQAHDSMDSFTTCILTANTDLDVTHTFFNVFLPPQTTCSPGIGGDHDQYLALGNWPGGVDVVVAWIPTDGTCNSNIGSLFASLTHEMVEAATDPNPASGTGFKVFGEGSCDEIGDLCAGPPCSAPTPTPTFLYATTQEYWVNGMNACFAPSLLHVPPGATPNITVSRVSGGGSSTIFSLTGTSVAGRAEGAPWDLSGGRTLYLKAAITHGQTLWGAGNIEGNPRISWDLAR